MKVSHFALMSPHRAGLYGTVKDLILAERRLGINAEFIDFGLNGEAKERMLSDGWLQTAHWQNALSADLVVQHSALPKDVNARVPYLLALHGRPVNTFLLSFQNGKPIIDKIYAATDQKMFRGCVTFWGWNAMMWRELLNPYPVYEVKPPVNLSFFTPEGMRYKFKNDGDFQVLIADMWREDFCPVHAVYRAMEAGRTLEKERGIRIKITVLGVPNHAKKLFETIKKHSRNPYLDQFFPMVETPEYLFRSADVLITGANIASRVVRETLACGTPIISLDGNPEFKAYTQDYSIGETDLAGAMLRVFDKPREETRRESREYAVGHFDCMNTGATIKTIFEKVINGERQATSTDSFAAH